VIGLNGQIGTISLVLAGLSGVVIVPLVGLLTDRVGRVVVYRWCAILQLLMAYPIWWVLSQGNATVSAITIAVALFTSWGMFATQGALLPELFGARHRYIGVAFGREISAVFAGGIAPLVGSLIIAWTANHYGGGPGAGRPAWMPLATYVAVLTLISLVTTFYTPETRGRDLDDLRDAGQTAGI